MSSTRPLIVALIRADLSSRRIIMEGVSRFAFRHANWDVLAATQVIEPASLPALLHHAHGVLVAPSDAYLPTVQAMQRPCVVLGENRDDCHCVSADERAIGAMALQHFREAGLKHVAYIGIKGAPFSEQRREGMCDLAKRHGVAFHPYPRTVYMQMDNDPHECGPFHAWLRGLPKPVGVLCVTAEMAHIVVHHCRKLNLAVPDEVAVLGVDDDDFVCEITRPHLSTIDQAADEIGFRGAQALEAILRDRRAPQRTFVKPRRVIVRESTDLVHSDSMAIGKALRYIRENATRELSVDAIARSVAISRRALERGFVRNFGRTVHQEILRLRLARAKLLLASTDLKTPDIAARSGFGSASMLCNTFRRELKFTPTQYRREARLESQR